MKISETLKYERLKRGLTQEEFANLLNINRSELSHYEHGRVPLPSRIKRFSELLGVDLARSISGQ